MAGDIKMHSKIIKKNRRYVSQYVVLGMVFCLGGISITFSMSPSKKQSLSEVPKSDFYNQMLLDAVRVPEQNHKITEALDNGADEILSALDVAASSNNAQAIEYILTYFAITDKTLLHPTPSFLALKKRIVTDGCEEIEMRKADLKANRQDKFRARQLFYAQTMMHRELIDKLKRGKTIAKRAVIEGKDNLFKYLLHRKPSLIAKEEYTSLFKTAINNIRLEVINEMLMAAKSQKEMETALQGQYFDVNQLILAEVFNHPDMKKLSSAVSQFSAGVSGNDIQKILELLFSHGVSPYWDMRDITLIRGKISPEAFSESPYLSLETKQIILKAQQAWKEKEVKKRAFRAKQAKAREIFENVEKALRDPILQEERKEFNALAEKFNLWMKLEKPRADIVGQAMDIKKFIGAEENAQARWMFNRLKMLISMPPLVQCSEQDDLDTDDAVSSQALTPTPVSVTPQTPTEKIKYFLQKRSPGYLGFIKNILAREEQCSFHVSVCDVFHYKSVITNWSHIVFPELQLEQIKSDDGMSVRQMAVFKGGHTQQAVDQLIHLGLVKVTSVVEWPNGCKEYVLQNLIDTTEFKKTVFPKDWDIRSQIYAGTFEYEEDVDVDHRIIFAHVADLRFKLIYDKNERCITTAYPVPFLKR